MVEDFDGSIELLVFGETYEKFKELLTPDSMVLIRGQVSMREGDKKPSFVQRTSCRCPIPVIS